MHYYQHHVGDYNRDTAALSIVEHGAYRLLMDAYYVTGKPLPDNLDALCRICRAMSKSERAAVSLVTTSFFQSDNGVLRHKRIDLELLAYEQQAETNRENGKKGGRPRKPKNNPPGFISLTQTDSETITETKGNHEPVTNNHTVSKETVGQNGASAARPNRQSALTDEEWLTELGADKTYEGINILREYGKMQRWCQQNNKRPTRARFVNWINRADQPMAAKEGQGKSSDVTDRSLFTGFGSEFKSKES